MNKYLKNAGITFFALCMSYALSAQTRYTDLEVVGISPAGKIKSGARLPLIFKITNHGPDDEVPGDTTFYRLYQVLDGVVSEVYTGMLGGAAKAAGESSSYRDNYSINSFNFPDLKEPITLDFCFELSTKAYLANGDSIVLSRQDTNSSNNLNCTKVTVLPRATGIQTEEIAGTGFSIYTNPAREVIVFHSDDATYSGALKVTISDFSGRRVLERQFDELEMRTDALSLNVGQLPVGVYVVQLQTKATSVAKRLTITP